MTSKFDIPIYAYGIAIRYSHKLKVFKFYISFTMCSFTFEAHVLCTALKLNTYRASYLKGTGDICLAVRSPNLLTTSIQSWI
jgi:hypothetical protein